MSDQALPPLVIQIQYIKDLSFEVPNAPAIFTRLGEAPEINVDANVNVQRLQDNFYEVVLHFEVKAKAGGETAFILELAFAAVVQANPEDPDHLQPLLLIEVPRLLFPFTRAIISDTTRDGGFPPLLLQPLDFVQLYRARLAQAAAEAEAAEKQ